MVLIAAGCAGGSSGLVRAAEAEVAALRHYHDRVGPQLRQLRSEQRGKCATAELVLLPPGGWLYLQPLFVQSINRPASRRNGCTVGAPR